MKEGREGRQALGIGNVLLMLRLIMIRPQFKAFHLSNLFSNGPETTEQTSIQAWVTVKTLSLVVQKIQDLEDTVVENLR
jgi:hypothetical protein